MSNFLNYYLNQIKVALLTLMVLGSFIVISFDWHLYGASASMKCQIAAIILILMYILIIFELVDRNLAALIGAAMSIAAHNYLLGTLDAQEILKWEDVDTLALLFGMMIVVGVLKQSGLFDYLAVRAYKSSAGRFWLLIWVMSFVNAILSAILDNVSTMLLMSPTIIKLSELEKIDPRYMLMLMVIASNIGGCATPIGDPPNLIVIGSSLAKSLDITFGSFTAYALPAAFLALVTALVHLKLVYKSKDEFRITRTSEETLEISPDVIHHQEQCPRSLRDVSEWRGFVVAVETSSNEPARQTQNQSGDVDMDELMRIHAIRSKPILVRASIVLMGAILLFFLQSLPGIDLTLGAISLFSALILLVLCSSIKLPHEAKHEDEEEEEEEKVLDGEKDLFEEVIYSVEWSTLIFFFALFIVMEAMSKLGLTLFIGKQITSLITIIPPGQMRSMGAITIILWSSGIASACIDNVPFTLAMVKVLQAMLFESDSAESLNPVALVYALVLGACLGGNGTLIGASCNLITAGVSARNGYPISFNSFFRFAAPVTLLTLVISNIYLIVVFEILKL